jgi:solute carrier family 7 (L-type amino acid transporter), member 6
MLLNALLAAIYILMGTFRGLLTFVGITEYLIFIFTVLALFRLRSRSPLPLMPSSSVVESTGTTVYRTHIVNPILFCVLSVFLVGRGVVTEPAQAAAITIGLGALWVIWRWKEKRASTARTGGERARLREDI